ncbi:Ig-like domain-containing protein [Candidatus Methanophagaceae archaeon]|nr:Ig-like domain-containing protein [Methanophagales archaeon]
MKKHKVMVLELIIMKRNMKVFIMERNRKQKRTGSIDKGIVCMGILILLVAGIGMASATTITVPPGESIQEAINNLPVEGGIIELAVGTHEVNDTLYPPQSWNTAAGPVHYSIFVNKSNVIVRGTAASIVKQINTSLRTFSIPDLESIDPNLYLENVTFDGFSMEDGTIQAMHVKNFTVKNMQMSGAGLRTVSCQNNQRYSYNIIYENNIFEGEYLMVNFAENVSFLNNTISNSSAGFPIYPDRNLKYIRIIGNKVVNAKATTCMVVDGGQYWDIRDNFFSGSRHGVRFEQSPKDVIFENNTITGTTERGGITIIERWCSSNITIRNNRIFSSMYGIYITPYHDAVSSCKPDILNNIIYGSTNDGVYTDAAVIELTLSNNIITNNGGYGINRMAGNITHSYNDIWGNAQGSYSGTTADEGEIEADPKFGDPANGDFHLKSSAGRLDTGSGEWVSDLPEDHSPCIDAGDPSSDYFNEPAYPLGHVNMGAYGNTKEASRSSGEDTTPTITAHSPTGSSAPVDTTLSVTFSEAMDKPSAEGAFSVDDVIGVFSWDGNKMIFTPSANFAYETTYTATIGTQAEDLAGNPLQSSYSWDFTTASSNGCYTYKLVNPGNSIQDAIDGLCAEGGTIELAAGIHDINDTLYPTRCYSSDPDHPDYSILVNKSNIIIQGTNESVLKQYNDSVVGFQIPRGGYSNITFKGLRAERIIGSGQAAFISADNVTDFTIRDTIAYSIVNYAVRSYQADPLYSRNIYYINNTMHGGGGLTFAFSTNIHVYNNTLDGNAGIDVNRDNKNIYIKNNYVIDAIRGVRLHGLLENMLMQNNTFSGRNPLYQDGSPRNCTIENNIFRNGRDGGLVMESQSTVENYTIRNNFIYDNEDSGIIVKFWRNAVSRETNIINNVIYNNDGDGIYLNENYWTLNVTNNIITNNSGYGINYISGSISHNYNDIWGNTQGNYSGTTAGEGDIEADPLFVDTKNGDFHIKPDSSPCIDTGVPYEEDPVFGVYVNEPVPNGGRINMGAYGNSIEASISANIEPIPGNEYIWLEAEDADITPDFVIANDASASSGEYIWIPEGTGWNPRKGEATYTIHINTSGYYVLWGTTIAAKSEDNSFFVQMDEGSEALWAISLSGTWHWNAVNHWGTGTELNPEIDPVVFTLAAGEHTLRIKQREDGTKLDRLLITNNMSYVPADTESTITGTVTTNTTQGETGIPDTNVTLATYEGAVINTTQTDSTGHYVFTNVAPGFYDLTATKRSYWPDSDPVTVNASEQKTEYIVLCRKGDFNTNSEPADAGDLAMMVDATVNATLQDWTYDLNNDGVQADEADLTLLKNVSVGVAELE